MLTPWFLVKLYSLSAVLFLAVDLVWIGTVASSFYQKQLGHLLRDQPLRVPALIFYAIYIFGVLVFAVLPGLEAESLKRSAALGALLGLLAYATFDLTAMAILKDFPLAVVLVDLAWGVVLTGSVAAAGFGIGRWLL
jgi:uncharacterized membrane protein